jgi:hypothetical protein
MQKADDLTVREAKEIAAMFSQPVQPAAPPVVELGLQIVVLDRGFVYVGEVTMGTSEVLIRNGSNVRRWGTTRGLGQLAAEGPTSDTVLDPTPLVRAPKSALMHLIACEVSKWPR